jgi:hypothetical protein
VASTIARALIEGATWESIQAQPYDGTRYPCGCHELQTENERLRADLAAEHALADQLADGLRDEARYHALRGNAARALDAHEEARRER